MIMLQEYLLKTRKKAKQCRDLFTKIEQRYDILSPSTREKATWLICFLLKSEHSYILRESNLKKLAEELDVKK